jgi:pimeloyl-[acyl-carrier protein] methyl ester esterase
MKMLVAALLLAAAPLTASCATVAPPSPAAAVAEVPARFSVIVEGSGPDVILIPGLMSGRQVWDGTVASLGGKYRVHRLQIAGFAGEPAGANKDGELLPAIVEALHTYIAANRLDRPALVGHSMGGLLSLMLAEKYPDDAGKVLIVDALPFYSMLFGPTATVDAVKPQAATMRDAIAAMGDEAFRAQQTAAYAVLVKTESARPALIERSLASDRGVGARAIYEVMTTDARPGLAALKPPLTVAYATNTFATEAMMGPLYRSYSAAPHARLVQVPDAYHFLMIDQPDRFNAILAEFLSGSE